jgi:hypothetical protein
VVVVSTDPVVDLGGGATSADDPTLNGGSLRVLSTAGGFDDTYPMPASGWSYIGSAAAPRGYRYKDTKQVLGPVKNATLKSERLRVSAKGSALGQTLGTNPDPVSVVLQTGGKHYCMSFGTGAGATTSFTADRQFTAKDASAPDACPP